MAAKIKQIIHGSVDAATSDDGATVTVTHGYTVDTSKTILLFSYRKAGSTTSGNCNILALAGVVASSTTIEFKRGLYTTQLDEILWTLVEFESGVFVQHVNGTISGTGTTTTVTLGTEVDDTQSIVLQSHHISAGTPDAWNRDDFTRAVLVQNGGSSGTFKGVTLTRDGGFGGINRTDYLQVVEFTDSTAVQLPSTTGVGTSGSLSLSPSIDNDSLFFLFSYKQSGTFTNRIDDVMRGVPDADPATAITLARKTATGNYDVQGFVCDLDTATVQHYDVAMADASMTVTTDLDTPVPTDCSCVVANTMGGGEQPQAVLTNTSSAAYWNCIFATCKLKTEVNGKWTQIETQRGQSIGSSNTVTAHIQVIQWAKDFAGTVASSASGTTTASAGTLTAGASPDFTGTVASAAAGTITASAGTLTKEGWFDAHTYTQYISLDDALAEKSAFCYEPDGGHLYTISNSTRTIKRFDRWGTPVGSTFVFPVGNDTEGIEHLGAAGSAYGGSFVVMEEGEGSSPYDKVRFYFFDMDESTTSVSSGDVTTVDCTDIEVFSGEGCEGAAYDTIRDKFYVVVQDTSSSGGAAWEVSISGGTASGTRLFYWYDTIVSAGYAITSVSDVAWIPSLPGSLFVLGWYGDAQTGQAYVFEVHRSLGHIISVLDIGGKGQIEGLAFDDISLDLYLTGEETNPNWFRWSYQGEPFIDSMVASPLSAPTASAGTLTVDTGGDVALTVASSATATPTASAGTIIPRTEIPIALESTGWRYWYPHGPDEGSITPDDAGHSTNIDYFSTSPVFYDPTFDPDSPPDSHPSWLTGQQMIGYGTLESSSGNRTVRTNVTDIGSNVHTLYELKYFNVTSAAEIGSAQIQFYRDDGVSVWLNGTHIAGSNEPGTIAHNAGASGSAAAGTDEGNLQSPVSIDPAEFVDGENVLAVAVWNNGGTSSDLGADFILTLEITQSAGTDQVLTAASSAAGTPTSSAGTLVTTTNTALTAASSATGTPAASAGTLAATTNLAMVVASSAMAMPDSSAGTLVAGTGQVLTVASSAATAPDSAAGDLTVEVIGSVVLTATASALAAPASSSGSSVQGSALVAASSAGGTTAASAGTLTTTSNAVLVVAGSQAGTPAASAGTLTVTANHALQVPSSASGTPAASAGSLVVAHALQAAASACGTPAGSVASLVTTANAVLAALASATGTPVGDALDMVVEGNQFIGSVMASILEAPDSQGGTGDYDTFPIGTAQGGSPVLTTGREWGQRDATSQPWDRVAAVPVAGGQR